MRRNATTLCAALLLVVLSGCSLFERSSTTDMQTSSGTSEDLYSPTADPYGASGGGYDAYGSSTGTTATYPSLTSADTYGSAAGQSRYHTVAKNDTLYGIARMYYNDERRWRDVYNANRDTLTDPNKIFVGQKLIVP